MYKKQFYVVSRARLHNNRDMWGPLSLELQELLLEPEASCVLVGRGVTGNSGRVQRPQKQNVKVLSLSVILRTAEPQQRAPRRSLTPKLDAEAQLADQLGDGGTRNGLGSLDSVCVG